MYFIIDALNKYKQGLKELIELISTSLILSDKVRWLVSSRPEVDLLIKLKNLDSQNLVITETLVELDMQSQKGRVEKYIKHKLSDLERFKVGNIYTDDIRAIVLYKVSEQAENNLLWISLLFKNLKTICRQFAIKKVKHYPLGLSKLYDYKMTRIENKTKHPKYCKDILAATYLTYCPASFSELAILVPWFEEIDPYTIIKECESFLTVRDETVLLIYKLAKDYLEVSYTSRLQQGGPVQGYADISQRSLDAMSKLSQNIYALPHVGSELGDKTVPSPDLLQGLRYSCVYWVQHVCQVYSQLDLYQSIKESKENSFDLHDNGQAHKFLEEHFLHWLEALSLMGKTSEGILMILSLGTSIPVSCLL